LNLFIGVRQLLKHGLEVEDLRKQDLTRYKIRKTTREQYLFEKYGMRWFNKVFHNRRALRIGRMANATRISPESRAADPAAKPYSFVENYLERPKNLPRTGAEVSLPERDYMPETRPAGKLHAVKREPAIPVQFVSPKPEHPNTSLNEIMVELNKNNRTMDMINANMADLMEMGAHPGEVHLNPVLEKRLKYIQDKLTTYNSDKLILGKLKERLKSNYSRESEATVQEIEARLRVQKNEIASLIVEIKKLKMEVTR
jgi:hypothetical protein